MASDPLRPPTTPPGSKASIVDTFYSADIPICEEQNLFVPSSMEEYEVPTAPPSPCSAPKLPDRPSPSFPDKFHESGVEMDTDDSDHYIIEADQGKCALCFLNCSDFSAYSRVAHMNRCWGGLLQRVKEHKDRQEKLADLQKRLEILIGKHKTKVQSASSLSDGSSVVDKAVPPSLSIEPVIASSPAGDANSNPDPEPSTTPPSSPLSSSIHTTSCLLCTLSLARLSPLNALAHRIYCLTLTDKCPTSCPICAANFRYPALWDKPDIIWHLHNCQSGGDLSLIDRDGFDALVAAWMGCMEVVERAVVGKMDGRAGVRVNDYKKKRDKGWGRGEGWYAAEPSKLRWGETLVEDGVEIARVFETWTPTWFREQQFRRHKFCVLLVPKDGRVFSRFRMQRMETELVYDEGEEEEEEEEEVEDNVSRERAVPTWSLPSIFDIDRPPGPRRMSVDSAMCNDTSDKENHVESHFLSIPGTTASRPSIFDVEDLEGLDEIIRPTATRVSSTPISGVATDGIKTPSLLSLRPPPGLHRPLFSSADFDHIFDAPQDSLESVYTACIEAKMQDEDIADDDAVSNSSGSTVSDHGMSDYYAAKDAAAREAANAALSDEAEPVYEEFQNFPSDRLEELPIVHLPPDIASTQQQNAHHPASPKPLEHEDRLVSDIDVDTATDFFSGCEDKTTVVLPHTKLEVEAQAQTVNAEQSAVPDEARIADVVEENDEDDTDAHEDWLVSRARTQAVLVGRISPGFSASFPMTPAHPTLPPSRVPNFLCVSEPEDDDSDDMDTFYYYPPRRYLNENLPSSVVTDVTEDMAVEEVRERNKGLCVFGGVDELHE
ncbi:hypothetical protein HBH42_166730 [Parastagonospora nodorum]|nr:hypothetical protein HBH42_166730 [Parastagonospora nodorum]